MSLIASWMIWSQSKGILKLLIIHLYPSTILSHPVHTGDRPKKALEALMDRLNTTVAVNPHYGALTIAGAT